MMKDTLTDELDVTFREVDRLTEQWEQAKSYERTLIRLRFLSSNFEALIEDVRRARSLSSRNTWSHMSQTLRHERPSELAALGQALKADDVSFMRVVRYLGFVRGVLAVLDAAKAGDPPPAVD